VTLTIVKMASLALICLGCADCATIGDGPKLHCRGDLSFALPRGQGLSLTFSGPFLGPGNSTSASVFWENKIVAELTTTDRYGDTAPPWLGQTWTSTGIVSADGFGIYEVKLGRLDLTMLLLAPTRFGDDCNVAIVFVSPPLPALREKGLEFLRQVRLVR